MANFVVSDIESLPTRRWQIFQGAGPTSQDVSIVNGMLQFTVWGRNPALSVPFAPRLGTDPNAFLRMKVRASCAFPMNWRDATKGAGAFTLQLRNQGILFESRPIDLMLVPNPVTPGQNNITVDAMRLVTPAIDTIEGPFRSDGNWTATLVCCNAVTGDPVVPALELTDALPNPLEMYFFKGGIHFLFAPSGHRLEIIRRSVMTITQYTALPHPVTRANYQDNAIRMITNDVWSMGLGNNNFGNGLKWYDVTNGAAAFNVGPHGGSLNLDSMFNRQIVNCYDLAATNQVWFASLGMRSELAGADPIIKYYWVFSGLWFGYVTEGPLFGWVNWNMPDQRWRRCNSPFWWVSNVPWYSAANLMDANRTAFGNHAWTEIVPTTAGLGQVVENCHAALGADVGDIRLALANITRRQYYLAAVNGGALTAANVANYQPLVYYRQNNGDYWVYDTARGRWFLNNGAPNRGLVAIFNQ